MANIKLRSNTNLEQAVSANASISPFPLLNSDIDNNFNNLNNDANTRLLKTGGTITGNLSVSNTSFISVLSTNENYSEEFYISASEYSSLHRSPNTINSMFVYQTQKDSDNGLWTDTCQNASWYNEELCGKWLGAKENESSARLIGITNDYYQNSSDGKFYKLNAGSGVTEVFRGNKRNFPKIAGIVVESSNVTIYDLTEANDPMWMCFVTIDTANINEKTLLSGSNCVSAVNGKIFIGGNQSNLLGLTTIDFILDKANLRLNTGYSFNSIINRNVPGGYLLDSSVTGISNTAINDVQSVVVNDAQVCPCSFIKLPTVAIATANGISVIQSNGSLKTSLDANSFTNITITENLLSASKNDSTWYYIKNPDQVENSFILSEKTNISGPDFNVGNTSNLIIKDRSTISRSSGKTLQILENNETSVNKGISVKITDEYNTGWMVGDIRRMYLANTVTGTISDNISDRSYKNAVANTYGTLTANTVGANTSLVGYSGFSANNYIQEPYSADLDFGTGEWSCSAWVNVPANATRINLFEYSQEFDNSWWTKANNDILPNETTGPDGISQVADKVVPTATNSTHTIARNFENVVPIRREVSVSAKAAGYNFLAIRSVDTWYVNNFTVFFDLANGTVSSVVGAGYSGDYYSIEPEGNGFYRCKIASQQNLTATQTFYVCETSGVTSFAGDGVSGIYLTNALFTSYLGSPYQPDYYYDKFIFSREFSSGPKITCSVVSTITGSTNIRAIAYDGTTTRTVTTSAAYNTGTWLKVRANYTTDGRLAILVNGVEVAATTGTPLLTLNNSNAVLTIGNSYALDAPFPGSIALLKLSATVPTNEQSLFMYEQEKQLFTSNNKCVLPANTDILDISYDSKTDTFITTQSDYESTWSGLIRTEVKPPISGNFSKTTVNSGIKLSSRINANTGVDISTSKINLKEFTKINKESQENTLIIFDYDGTATQTAFPLQSGYKTKAVFVNGSEKREGVTKDYIINYDGFIESVNFTVAPNNWVQIHTTRA